MQSRRQAVQEQRPARHVNNAMYGTANQASSSTPNNGSLVLPAFSNVNKESLGNPISPTGGSRVSNATSPNRYAALTGKHAASVHHRRGNGSVGARMTGQRATPGQQKLPS